MLLSAVMPMYYPDAPDTRTDDVDGASSSSSSPAVEYLFQVLLC